LFCSVIIPTIGRDSLSRAVCSVLEQPFSAATFEVIVVNDSGHPLPPASWQQSERVRIVHTNRRERSVARNTGAAIALGTYLCFLDDDDWLLPRALQHIYSLAGRAGDAAWLYGGIQVMDENGRCLAELNSGLNGNCLAQVMGGAWVPIQSSFIQNKAFFAVGGYDPHICGTEDEDLCRRIARYGPFANTPQTLACLFRGTGWHTSTNYLRAAEDTRRSRDAVLNEPGVFGCLLSSADSSYWYGRIFRVYLSAVGYNLRRKRIAKAASRSLFGLASVVLTNRRVFTREFWRAATADHAPHHLHFVMAALEEKVKVC
jgi:glycosyltransferase involved in cell wall biosynthesis